MKLSKLYIKIFISFVIVLCVTEVLILGLFIFGVTKHFRSRIDRHISAHVLMAKELVEDKIASAPIKKIDENESLKDIIKRLGDAYGAKVWLTGAQGLPLLKSFRGTVPEHHRIIQSMEEKDFSHFKMYHGEKWEFYAVIPTEIGTGESGGLHVLFEKKDRDPPEVGFILGLLGIGAVIALLVIPVSRFITERIKRLNQSALRIAEGDLSHRVKVKGKDEIGELGRTFNRMTEKLERMIRGGKELTANISHELRTPLARIRIAEELINDKLKRQDYQDLARHLKDIREDIGELDRLIGRILALSKLDIQETPLRRENFDPSALIDELLDRYKTSMDRRSLHIKTDMDFEGPLSGDREAIHTALSNIFDNAVKFSPDGGKIFVEMKLEGDSLKIGITNNAGSLSSEALENIFEPFYRVKDSRAAGSGLGLAITRKIIEKHGGVIEAANTPEGLKITIRLPLAQGKD